VAGDRCHQPMVICHRAVMAGQHLFKTRAAQFVKVSVAGTWPASHGGWPVRRGVRGAWERWCPPACAGNVGKVCRWRHGRRAKRAWLFGVGACICGPLSRPRGVHQPAAQPAHQA
jgi:hypothetical protein